MRIVLMLAGLVAACASASTPYQRNPADEAIYLARYQAQMQAQLRGGGISNYDPLEAVPGATGAAALPAASPSAIPAAALDGAVAYVADRNSTALIVWHNGAIVHEKYFAGYGPDSLINAKALAKPLTSIIVGRAIAQGFIKSLDQPAADFITEWQDDAERRKITIRHLLGMRSGLLPQDFDATEAESVLQRAYLHPRHEDVLIHEYPLTHAPGSRYEYSNANAELIAPIIERATGQRYATYLGTALLQPLGAAGGTIWVNRPGGMAHSGCCIQLPAHSWLRLATLLLQDGVWDGQRLLPEGYVGDMRTADALNPHAGLGVWIAGEYVERRGPLNPAIPLGQTYHSAPYLADDLFLFDGNGNQVVYIVPSRDLVILRTGGFPAQDKGWDNSYLPNLLIRGLN